MTQIVWFISFTMLLFVVGCSENTDQSKRSKRISENPQKIEESPEDASFDTSKVSFEQVFFQFIPTSDSTSYIQWGDSNATFQSKNTVENKYINSERLHVNWYNDQFISLIQGTGSDSWSEIILPMQSNSNYREFYNTLAVDQENGIVLYEYPAKDSNLIAEKIMTGDKLIIGKEWKRCGSAFPHYCIDSIHFQSKELYIEWITPDRFERTKQKVYRETIHL